jgi:hypothetical protein
MADSTAARMTAFKPGASPPPVEMAIRLIVFGDCAKVASYAADPKDYQPNYILIIR